MKLRTVDETTVGRLLTPAAARRLMRATLRASALGDAHGPMRAVLAAAGGAVVDEEGQPLRYGKTAQGLRNPSFIAWGLREASA